MERQGARFTTETGLTDQAIYYSDSGIKRAAEYRTQSSWLLNAFSRPDSLSKWEPGRYSVLAGFVEIGETFEMAIVREVQEEAGITVDRSSIRYVATQPWPFPSSLMVGFMASAEKNESSASKYSPMPREQVVPIDNLILSTICDIDSLPKPVVDGNELEDAKWIHKDFLRAVLSGKSLPPGVQFHVPGKYAIAHYLLDKWITESRCNKWAADEIETVQIDEGVFKYVLIRVHDNNGSQKLIVRGNSALAYHADILKQARDKIGPSRLQADPLGGGRIEHHPEQKVIHIYGFSQAYGQANHAVTAALLRQWLPFHEISVSWDGY